VGGLAVSGCCRWNVYTRDGAEWLLAETESGEQLTLRLDSLRF